MVLIEMIFAKTLWNRAGNLTILRGVYHQLTKMGDTKNKGPLHEHEQLARLAASGLLDKEGFHETSTRFLSPKLAYPISSKPN